MRAQTKLLLEISETVQITMPELPEVHTTATILNKLVTGLSITDIWSGYKSAFHEGKNNIKNVEYFKEFKKKIIGQKIIGVSRRGKNVLIDLSGNETILVHMKMTGHLLYGRYAPLLASTRVLPGTYFGTGTPSRGDSAPIESWRAVEVGALQDPFNQYIRLVFSLSNKKHLAFSDLRKFAKVCLLKTDELEKSPDLRELGPEPLEKKFTLEVFRERLALRPNTKIKQALMDQTLIAGIGNIYSDEMLWLSSIHPETPVKNIPEKKMKELFGSMKKVLRKGIDFQGDSTSDYRNPYGEAGAFHHKHQAYRRTGEKCYLKGCNGTIRRIIVGGRSAHFCDVHQIRAK